MIIDITNNILTDIKMQLPEVNVITSFQSSVSKFPTILVEEIDNSHHTQSKDSGGFQHSNIGISIEIYTNGSRRMSNAKDIRNRVDVILVDKYGMTRSTPTVIPNFLDDAIYRYKIIYSGVISKNKTIYGR